MNPTDLKNIFQELRTEANKVLVGLEEPFELLAIALFTGGHVLLEGVPGTAKTLMAKTLRIIRRVGREAVLRHASRQEGPCGPLLM